VTYTVPGTSAVRTAFPFFRREKFKRKIAYIANSSHGVGYRCQRIYIFA